MKINVIIEESIDERFSKSTPVLIELDDETLSILAIAIFNANVHDLFGKARNLIEKLKRLDILSSL